ncbi:hypothetical protein N9H20_05870 [Planktomarina temperata]|nr:hypothetical protein [Planktomarina temperata]
MRRLITTTLIFIISATFSFAEDAKFEVEGDILFYNTEKPGLIDDYITYSDVASFRSLLVQNPEISTLNLNSLGGLTEAGLEVARVVADFNVSTTVSGECSSSCALIFLAGKDRQLQTGGLLGFHRPIWSAAGMEKHYNNNRSNERWGDAFDFSSWLMADTFFVAGKIFKVYSEAGAAIDFAAATLSINNDQVWYPSRSELEAAGIINSTLLTSIRPRARTVSSVAGNYDISSNITE